MQENPIADELERVLNFNGQPITIHVPDNAVIVPGTGADIYDGMTITHWSED